MQNEERINGLETQVRTLKRIVYGFGCVLLAGIVVGATSLQTVPDVIQAKKFEVVNDEGKVVASFYANMGGGMLSVSNKDGEVVVGLGSDEVNGGGVLGINNKDGKIVAGIHADENGGVARVLNNTFTEVVVISANANGGMVVTSNDKGGTLVTLGANKSEGGLITSYSGKGVALAAFGASPDGNGVAVTYDKAGKGITSITPAP